MAYDHQKYMREVWYPRNRAKHMKLVAASKGAVRLLIDRSKSQPCRDCGNSYPTYVMQFDHKRNKLFNLADAVSKGCGIERVRLEIAKCDVVCANCHAIRTHKRKCLTRGLRVKTFGS